MAGAIVAIGAACVMIDMGGRAMRSEPQQATALVTPKPVVEPAPEPRPKRRPVMRQEARAVAPTVVAPPPIAGDELERVEPRDALSPLSQALPPKPRTPDQWDGTLLYQPVAVDAGTLKAKGYTVAIAGVEPLAADHTCGEPQKTWPCGVRARAAFRAMLRGRAVSCVIPPEADRTAIVAECRIGKTDIGSWLVANGWARATAKGPYREAGQAAQKAGKGIFGPAPDANAPPPGRTATTLQLDVPG